MRTEEEIRLKKAYLEGFIDGREESSCYENEIPKSQIEILDWVLEDDIKYVVSDEINKE